MGHVRQLLHTHLGRHMLLEPGDDIGDAAIPGAVPIEMAQGGSKELKIIIRSKNGRGKNEVSAKGGRKK